MEKGSNVEPKNWPYILTGKSVGRNDRTHTRGRDRTKVHEKKQSNPLTIAPEEGGGRSQDEKFVQTEKRCGAEGDRNVSDEGQPGEGRRRRRRS